MDYKTLYADLFGNLFTNIPELEAIIGECIDNNHDVTGYIRGDIDEDAINETVRLALDPEPGGVNEDGENEDDMYLARIGYSDKDEQKTTTILSVDPPVQTHEIGGVIHRNMFYEDDINPIVFEDDINPIVLISGQRWVYLGQRSDMGDDEVVEQARIDISEVILRQCERMRLSIDLVKHLVESILLSFRERGVIHRHTVFWDDMRNILTIRIGRGPYACQFSFDKYLLTFY
jgi:hypothetical protein